MNGRIYDPTLGRMLQADPIRNPGSQGLNRYSYVASNPLTLTDPTGYSFWNSFFGSVVHVVIDAVLYATGNGEFAPWVDAVWAAAATNGNIGAAAAAFISSYYGGQITQGIGGSGPWVSNPAADFLIKATANALAQGVLQGTLATLQGQSFGNAFRSAAISTFASSFGPRGNDAQAGITRAIIGGTASAITGGKFANGAITALAVWAAESATERIADGAPPPPPDGSTGSGSDSGILLVKLYDATVLDRTVPVAIIGGAADEQTAVQGRLGAAFDDINQNAGSLSSTEAGTIQGINSVTVGDEFDRTGINVRTGNFNLMSSYVLAPGSNPAWLASVFAHDSYHVYQHGLGLENTPALAPMLEQQANAFQISVGESLG